MHHNHYNIPDEQHLREKLQAYQPDFEEQAWMNFQKQLPVAPETPVNPNNIHTATAAVRRLSVAATLFTTINLYYTMLMLWMSVALSGHLERPAPTPPCLPISAPHTLPAEIHPSDHRAAPIASVPTPEKRSTRAVERADGAVRQKTAVPKCLPPAAVAQVNTGAFLGPNHGNNPAATEQSAEYTTQTDARGVTLPGIHDTLQETADVPFAAVSPLAAGNYALLGPNLAQRADSLPRFKAPYRSGGGRYTFGASLLRGLPNGLLLRAEFIRMLGSSRFGVGGALLMAQYDQENTYDNIPALISTYYIGTAGLDATLNFHQPLGRIAECQVFGGFGYRHHLIGQTNFGPSGVDPGARETQRFDKVGFDLGAQLLFRIKDHFRVGVQYIFYKDYLDDISDRSFAGLAFQWKF